MKMSVVGQLNALITHFMSLEKVGKLVLPMPYNQLLKLNLIMWTFTLPFVIVQSVGWFCPYAPRHTKHCLQLAQPGPGRLADACARLTTRFVMFFIAAAYFGLDQVGVMLESPFGTDAADISLLSLGMDLTEDLDVYLRTASNMTTREQPFTEKRRTTKEQELRKQTLRATELAEKLPKAKDDQLPEGFDADQEIRQMVTLIKDAKAAGVHVHKPTLVDAAESTLKELREAAQKALKAKLKKSLLVEGESLPPSPPASPRAKEEDDDDDDDAAADDAGDAGGE